MADNKSSRIKQARDLSARGNKSRGSMNHGGKQPSHRSALWPHFTERKLLNETDDLIPLLMHQLGRDVKRVISKTAPTYTHQCTQTDRQTDRQKQTDTHRHADTQTHTKTCTHTHAHKHMHTYAHSHLRNSNEPALKTQSKTSTWIRPGHLRMQARRGKRKDDAFRTMSAAAVQG